MGLDILLEWQVLSIIALLAVATPVIIKSRPAPAVARVRTSERAERAVRRPDEAVAIAAITAQVSQNLHRAEAARARLMADLSK